MAIGPDGEIVTVGTRDIGDPFRTVLSRDDLLSDRLMGGTGNSIMDNILSVLMTQEIVVTAPGSTPTLDPNVTVRSVFDGNYEMYIRDENGVWVERDGLWRPGSSSNWTVALQGEETEESYSIGVTGSARGIEGGIEGSYTDRDSPQSVEYWIQVPDAGM